MTPEEPTHIALPAPTQCVLWDHPERVPGSFARCFEELESYEDTSHLSRSLYKCRECGQLYFHEWYEWVDWDEGHDIQYSTLLPVRSVEQGAELNNVFGLMRYLPRLHLDAGKAQWFGKN
jgi:hypothetical protein